MFFFYQESKFKIYFLVGGGGGGGAREGLEQVIYFTKNPNLKKHLFWGERGDGGGGAIVSNFFYKVSKSKNK